MIELTSTKTGSKIFFLESAIAVLTKDKGSKTGRGAIIITPAGVQINVTENPTTVLFLLAGAPGCVYANDEHPHSFFSREPANEIEPEEYRGNDPNHTPYVNKLDALMEWWPSTNGVTGSDDEDSAPVGSAVGELAI